MKIQGNKKTLARARVESVMKKLFESSDSSKIRDFYQGIQIAFYFNLKS